MWLYLAFLSALLLGFYDVAKKRSLAGNAVLPFDTVAAAVKQASDAPEHMERGKAGNSEI